MRLMTFNQARLYLRRDVDAGWTLALWKWRVFFNSARPGVKDAITDRQPNGGRDAKA